MRSKTKSSREHKPLFTGTILVLWKSVIAVVAVLLTSVSLQGCSIIKASCREDTAAPALCPHTGLFAALQSLSYDL